MALVLSESQSCTGFELGSLIPLLITIIILYIYVYNSSMNEYNHNPAKITHYSEIFY